MSKIYLKEMTEQSKTIKVDIPGMRGKLDVTYNPGRITPKFWEKLNSRTREGDFSFSESKVMQIVEFVTDWSIVDDEDDPLPVDQETVRTLPTQVLDLILDGIQKDLYPDQTPDQISRSLMPKVTPNTE